MTFVNQDNMCFYMSSLLILNGKNNEIKQISISVSLCYIFIFCMLPFYLPLSITLIVLSLSRPDKFRYVKLYERSTSIQLLIVHSKGPGSGSFT